MLFTEISSDIRQQRLKCITREQKTDGRKTRGGIGGTNHGHGQATSLCSPRETRGDNAESQRVHGADAGDIRSSRLLHRQQRRRPCCSNAYRIERAARIRTASR